jgi:hypothetical protein
LAEIEIAVPLGSLVLFAVVALVVFKFFRRFLWRFVANSALGVVVFVLLNAGGFKVSYTLLNVGLVAVFGLAGLVLVIVLRTLGWTS